MLNREQLETFATVVVEGSFERAATVLNVTRGAISQRIKALENSLASVLLVREKPVIPTPAGEVLLRHVNALRLLEGAALSALTPQRDARIKTKTAIAISVNADSLATWFPQVLWPLMLNHLVALEVVVDDQDHTVERLARGEVLGCISTGRKPATGFSVEPLGAMEYRCLASKPFVEQYFLRGLSAQSAVAAPAVLFNRKDALHDEFLAQLFGFSIPRYTKHYLPAPITLLDGILAGVGYGLVPTMQTRAHLERDLLVDLAPDSALMIDLYWHHWEVEPPLSAELTQHVVEVASRLLDRPPLPKA